MSFIAEQRRWRNVRRSWTMRLNVPVKERRGGVSRGSSRGDLARRSGGWGELTDTLSRTRLWDLWAALVLTLLAGYRVAAQTTAASVNSEADAFVRSLAPAGNYGGGGALSVSGSAAVNASGDQNGLFDTLMRFSMSNVVASLDGVLGGPDWIVTQVRLVLNEMAAPDNAIFNRGVGGFEIRWLASDNWLEGTGRPNAPTSDGVAWQELSQIVNSNLDESLGVFTNRGANGPIAFDLALGPRFIADLHLGGEVGLYLTSQSPEVGFTFNSRNFGNTNAQPELVLTATANPRPRIDAIEPAGTNVLIRFGTVSNWIYTLQVKCGVSAAGGGAWSNLLIVPAQPFGSTVIFLEPVSVGPRLYRLSMTP